MRNPFFNQYSTGTEQDLHESLIIESIQQYGFDVLYIPRVSLDTDNLYTEYSKSAYVGAIPIEMYVKDVMGFGGQGDFASSFGLEMRDTMTLTVAQKRFNDDVVANTLFDAYTSANVTINSNTSILTDQTITISRPREGDLIHIPFANTTYEIRYTENEAMFYPLGKLQTYDLRIEQYEYSNEYFATGLATLDTHMNGLSLKTTVSANSAAIANNDTLAQNFFIEEEADAIIDFTEMDPFASGEY